MVGLDADIGYEDEPKQTTSSEYSFGFFHGILFTLFMLSFISMWIF